MPDIKPPPKIRTAHYHDADGLWTGEAVCRAGHALPLPDLEFGKWCDAHGGCQPTPDAWAEIEAPLIAQGERDAKLLRQRLAEDEAVARAATQGAWRLHRRGKTDSYPWMIGAETDRDIVGDGWDGGVWSEADGQHIVCHGPARVLNQCASIGDALTELERITERSPDPDSRAWARAAICSLRRIWEADE